MKKIHIILAVGLIFFTSCTGIKTLTTGLENESFLVFIGNSNIYNGGIDVNIDDKSAFKAEVNQDHTDRPKGKVYVISTGTHIVTISYNNKVIFRKQIYVSAQETKRIMLP